MFVDQAKKKVWAGSGGHGCVSFRRERSVPRGGPAGGDGGRGGHVILVASSSLNTLLDLPGRSEYHAGNGGSGSGSNRHGADGDDCTIRTPVGTLVTDAGSGALLEDLCHDGDSVVVARGGRGGWGNKHFASSTDRTPRRATRGEPGQTRTLLLELKLLADVGLVGLPNAGKSTLLGRLSAARPKVADYPFTTLRPYLGIIRAGEQSSFVMADIPGLVLGAHAGVGLGDRFLRHIERTRLLVHLIDAAPLDGALSPVESYHAIRTELAAYGHGLDRRDEIVVANKLDLPQAAANLETLAAQLSVPVLGISAIEGKGLQSLVRAICFKLNSVAS